MNEEHEHPWAYEQHSSAPAPTSAPTSQAVERIVEEVAGWISNNAQGGEIGDASWGLLREAVERGLGTASVADLATKVEELETTVANLTSMVTTMWRRLGP